MAASFTPLPVESDYTVATQLCRENFESQGGPWAALYRYEMESHNSLATYDDVYFAAYIARTLEPTDSVSLSAFDPLQTTTHAFKHGMMAGFSLTGVVNTAEVSPRLSMQLLHEDIERIPAADASLRPHRLVQLGELGLARAGSKAVEEIESWEEDVVSDVRAQRMFRLGCGAIIHAAYSIHEAINNNWIEAYCQQTNFDDELQAIITSDTGEN